jgi:hypothetical protein
MHFIRIEADGDSMIRIFKSAALALALRVT